LETDSDRRLVRVCLGGPDHAASPGRPQRSSPTLPGVDLDPASVISIVALVFSATGLWFGTVWPWLRTREAHPEVRLEEIGYQARQDWQIDQRAVIVNHGPATMRQVTVRLVGEDGHDHRNRPVAANADPRDPPRAGPAPATGPDGGGAAVRLGRPVLARPPAGDATTNGPAGNRPADPPNLPAMTEQATRCHHANPRRGHQDHGPRGAARQTGLTDAL
jgi:hypothetical protein